MITIHNGMKISNIQNIFNTAFPFLKLEFLQHSPKLNGNNRTYLLKTNGAPEGQLNGKDGKEFVITEDLTVATMEHLFMDYFNLSTQVFRKSGKSWLETALTDDWTLKKQNDEGVELSGLKL